MGEEGGGGGRREEFLLILSFLVGETLCRKQSSYIADIFYRQKVGQDMCLAQNTGLNKFLVSE